MKPYRLLKEGEIILSTDRYWDDSGRLLEPLCVGDTAPDPSYTSHRQYVRFFNKLITPPTTLESHK